MRTTRTTASSARARAGSCCLLFGALFGTLLGAVEPAYGLQASDVDEAGASLEQAETLDAGGFDERALVLYREWTSAHPGDARAWFHVARLAPEEEASEAIDRAVALEPDDTDLGGWRLLFRMDHGLEVTDEDLARFEASGPSDLTGLTVKARRLLAQGESGEGLALAAALMRQFHDLGYVAGLYRRLLAASGALDPARVERGRTAPNLDWDAWSLDLGERATTAAGLLAWAETALVLRLHERVIARLTTHFETAPADLELGRLLTRALIEHGQLEAAGAHIRTLAEAFPEDVDLMIDGATVQARRGVDSAAFAMIRAAADKAPEHPRVRLSLAQLARREQRLDDALALVEAMLAADAGDTLALGELAAIHTLRGEYALAAAANERVLRQRPWLLNQWIRCAQDYARGGEIERGRETLALARKLGVAPDLADRIEAYIDSEEDKKK